MYFRITAALVTLLISTFAQAHSRLVGSFVPRDTSSGIKVGPCGGDAHSATPAIFQAGSTVPIQWEETIQHTGHFEFYFSVNDDSQLFTMTNTSANMILSVVDDQNDSNVPHEFSHQITLPSTPCDTCTIQLIQVMIDNHPTSPSYYFSCADVRLVKDLSVAAPAPAPASTPVSCSPNSP